MLKHRVAAAAARPRHARTAAGRRMTAGALAMGLLGSQLVVASAGAAYAGSGAPTVTFAAPSVAGFNVTLSYSVNRAPQQISGVVCSLTIKGGAAANANCGNQTGSSSSKTSYAVTVSGLNAGTYTYGATVRLEDTGAGSGTTTFTIKSMNATCKVTPYNATYNGAPSTATGSCTGAGGVSLPSGDLNLSGTTHADAGTYPGDKWTFTDPTGNYTNPGGTIADAITPANAICTVSAYSATFDGNAHTATGSCTGAGGVSLPSGDLNLSGTSHTFVGSYPTDSWSFSDPKGNYTNARGTVADAITQATANCKVTSYSTPYDGSAHTATGSCTGAGGVSLPSSDLNLINTTHTSAGIYPTDTWSFTDPNGNYTNPGGTVADAITQATANCTVTAYGATFDGSPHSATGICTGVGGVNLSGDLNLAATAHTNAGTYADAWSFSDPTGNYTNPGGTVTDTIGQATATCTVGSYSVTFDGGPHSATGICTGVGGVNLTGDLNLASTTHTNAGSYSTDAWTFTDPNYTNPGGNVTDTIGQATASCTVGSYSATYDGNAHTDTGSCTGVGGVNLTGDLNLASTTHTNAGSYSTDAWTFSDPNGNYTNPGGTSDDSIGQATANCTVTGYNVPSDGNPHTATGSCTDITGTPLPSSDLNSTQTTHTGVGTYPGDTWTFNDPNGNYSNPGGTITDVITAVIAAQTLSFTSTAPTGAVVGATPYYTPAATTTATDPNLQVTLTVDPAAASVCSINTNGTLNFDAPGTCTIDANQGGDHNYLPATQVQQTFTISVPLAAIPQVNIDFPDNPQNPVLPPDPAVSSCPKQQFPDGGCAINDLDGTVANTFAATATDPNPDPSHDTITYSWFLFYPPIFGIPGVTFSDAGITGLGWLTGPSPNLQIAAGSLPQLVGDKKAGGDPYWRARLTVTVNGYTSTESWFRFIYDSNFPLDFSTNCQLFGQFMGLNCALVAPQMLPFGDTSAPQTIAFQSKAPTSAVVGGATYTPVAVSSSFALNGPPIALTIDPASTAVCALNSDGSVSFNAVGTCIIDANQPGLQGQNISYTPAPQVQQSFNVGPAT